MSNNLNSNQPPVPVSPEPARNAPIPPAAPRRKWVTPVLALIAVLVIGLFGGVLIGHATASSAQASNLGGFSRGAGGGNRGAGGAGLGGGAAGLAGGGLTSGTIVSISGTTMVVKAKNGTTKTVTTSGTTKVSQTSATTLSTLKAGQTVTVIGAAGSNGDIVAKSVFEGASLRGFGGRAGRATGGAGAGSTTGTNG